MHLKPRALFAATLVFASGLWAEPPVFRAYLSVSGRAFFLLVDEQNSSGRWTELGGRCNGFVVVAHDPRRDELTIADERERRVLALRGGAADRNPPVVPPSTPALFTSSLQLAHELARNGDEPLARVLHAITAAEHAARDGNRDAVRQLGALRARLEAMTSERVELARRRQ